MAGGLPAAVWDKHIVALAAAAEEHTHTHTVHWDRRAGRFAAGPPVSACPATGVALAAPVRTHSRDESIFTRKLSPIII